jgi:alkylhydroperoxidase family enzyme
MFVEPVPADDAGDLYDRERERLGYLPNYVRAFSHRPDVYWAWRGLVSAIQGASDPRRYELATLAAAKRLRSSYCSLAHGKMLVDRFYTPDQVLRLPGGLDKTDAAITAFAEQVVDDASSVTQADVDRLREVGLSDAEITDVVLAAAARSFFAKTLDALGALPDSVYGELAPELREELTVGRPIDGSA